MAITETQGLLKKSGQVTLDANGNGVLIFDPDSANQRWVVDTVVVTTNQPGTATTVPTCTIAMNTTQLSTMSPGNQRGSTWSGNQDVFTNANMDIGPCDFLSVIFSPLQGTSGAALNGVIATAVITGTKYTRRA